jgi:phosphoribosylformimino-5-aminoimidazole carboxamide ribotide isomerase
MPAFEVIPAIDLRGGRAVRLYQGDYSAETVYDADPIAVAHRWRAAGATRLHLVDLDGARTGQRANAEVIAAIVREVGLPAQVGGGLRTVEAVHALWRLGVERAILGSAAVSAPRVVKSLAEEEPERVVVGIDARDGAVAVHGWQSPGGVQATELALSMVGLGVRRFIFTDIGRDCTALGPNIEATADVARLSGAAVIASGGVGSLDHIAAAAAAADRGIEGIVVGRALYTGEVELAAAIESAAGVLRARLAGERTW